MAAGGGRPEGVPSKLGFAMAPGDRADAAAATVLAHLLSTIEQNLPGTLADVDTEFLHDLRVAVRRTRSVQRAARRRVPGRGPARPLPRRVPPAAAGHRTDARPRRAPARLRPPGIDAAGRSRARTSSPCAACSPLTAATSASGCCGRCGRPAPSARSPAGRRSSPVSPTHRDESPRRRAPDRRGRGRADPPRPPADGQDGPRDRRRQPARGAARPAQEGQGAALPARAVRQRLSARRDQAVGAGAEDAPGRARALPGPRGAGRAAALAARRRRGASTAALRR